MLPHGTIHAKCEEEPAKPLLIGRDYVGEKLQQHILLGTGMHVQIDWQEYVPTMDNIGYRACALVGNHMAAFVYRV